MVARDHVDSLVISQAFNEISGFFLFFFCFFLFFLLLPLYLRKKSYYRPEGFPVGNSFSFKWKMTNLKYLEHYISNCS